MSKHIETGKKGEELALAYFKSLDYQILHQNWRHSHWEIDLIASKGRMLHFIEVKTKTSNRFGYPEDEVDVKKINYLTSAAEVYLQIHPEWKWIQFDILAITLSEPIAYFLIQDVYL